MKNTELKKEIRSNGIFLYEVANALGISSAILSKKLHGELLPEDEKQIKKVINQLSNEDTRIYSKMDGNRLETIWYCMHTRCYNESHKSYKNYGARGIKICGEWLGKSGKINFYKWAISHGYKENLTIDRINTDGDYEPDNCRWVDYTEQNNNRRISIRVLYNGEKVTLLEASKVTGIEWHTLYMWYRKEIKDFTNAMPPIKRK